MKLHNERGFNGTVLISEEDAVIYEKSFGNADYKTQVPLSEKSIFNIASVSKTFTVVAIMILEEKGLLRLDDDIKKYFPELPYENITIKNLLSHTSGLRRVQSNPFRKLIEGKGNTNNEIITAYIEAAPLLKFESGTSYFYANTNYYLLALIIEQISNQNYNSFITSRIFKKAGMNETFLKSKRVPNSKKRNIVTNHSKPSWLSTNLRSTKNTKVELSDSATFGEAYGASEIHTTAKDLFKFHSALQKRILLKSTTLKKMYQPYVLTNTDYTVDEASNYPSHRALGWCVSKEHPEILYHSGGTYGTRSFFIRNIDKDQSIIILTNNQNMNRYNFTFAMRLLNNETYTLDPISLPRVFCSKYLEIGIQAALKTYKTHREDDRYKAFVSWDFEEIGQELLARDDAKAAIELFRLYTEEFPDEYSWESLGNAFLADNQLKKAKDCYLKSIEINPKYASAIRALKALK
ncbi:serine hydrolase [uncultured Croceitalea sp.]|uniref:serine hydrolase n=1 Tax=uncultured Croceitalea sp. TaxID=1798908 RepID=UPI0033055E56